MSDLIAAASTWFTGEIDAPKMQANLIDQVNTFYTAAGADTGWQNITIASGFKAGGFTTDGPQYRVFHGVVYFQGFIQPTSGSFAASSTITICPAGAIPSTATGSSVPVMRMASSNALANPGIVWVGVDGSVNLKTGTSPPAYISVAALGPYPAS